MPTSDLAPDAPTAGGDAAIERAAAHTEQVGGELVVSDADAAQDAYALTAIIDLVSDSARGYRVDAAVLEGLQRVRDRRARTARGDSDASAALRDVLTIKTNLLHDINSEETEQALERVRIYLTASALTAPGVGA